MKNEFVPYKEALALKELGFDYCCFCSYNSEGKLAGNYGTYYKIHLSEVTIAPLFQQAFRWFREKYNLFSNISPKINYPDDYISGQAFHIEILDSYSKELGYDDGVYSYEEAQDACLRKLIEIVKEKQAD